MTFTRFVAPAEPTGAWLDYYEQWPFALQPPDDPMYELVAPFADRPAVTATTFGKWDELAALVGDDDRRGRGVDGLLRHLDGAAPRPTPASGYGWSPTRVPARPTRRMRRPSP